MITSTLTGTRSDLFRALGVLAEPPGAQHARLAGLVGVDEPGRPAWTEAFVVQLVPHASVYLSGDGMLGGEAADRVAGFWRALRLQVPADADHVSALLGLYATVLEAEAAEPAGPRQVLLGQARAALLHEHLLSWLLAYTSAMSDVGPAVYAQWAELLRQALLAEATELVGAAGGARLPAHLRDLPPWSADADDRGVVDGLLVPARTGLVLARGHLARAARQRGLGLRLGDRRLMLRTLLEQDPQATLGWLAEHANAASERHRAEEAAAGPVAAFWAARAQSTAVELEAAALGLGRTEPVDASRNSGRDEGGV